MKHTSVEELDLDDVLEDLLESNGDDPKIVEILLLQAELDARLKKSFRRPGGLLRFVRHFWPVLEPDTEFREGWALEAMCLHLEAVFRGEVKRLLINIPPGSMKSLLTSVFFPAWVWGPMGKPGARFLCMSYSVDNPMRDNRKTINLIQSEEYQRLYGRGFSLVKAGEELLENTRTGFKQAVGIRGSVTGKRADYLIVDDPNNIAESESEAIREETNRKFREAVANRLNDMVTSSIIVIQQRSHEDDVSGLILRDELPYEHLCVPMLYEVGRHCSTKIGWSDPRSVDGECFWPERFPDMAVRDAKSMGEFAFAGQYQQRPEPRGGGLLKRDYWRDWDPEPNIRTGRKEYPKCDLVVASLDPAFTAKEENDPSGFTVWGAFQTQDGERAVILLDAFRERLTLYGGAAPRREGETQHQYKLRTGEDWGLIETVLDRLVRYGVDALLVENKASGLTIIQEMARLFPRSKCQVIPVDPKGLDKTARVIRVQPEFASGCVYAPVSKPHASMVINECAAFPKGKHDDLVDSTTQAIWWLRSNGYLQRPAERRQANDDMMRSYRAPQPLYNI